MADLMHTASHDGMSFPAQRPAAYYSPHGLLRKLVGERELGSRLKMVWENFKCIISCGVERVLAGHPAARRVRGMMIIMFFYDFLLS